MLKKITSDTHDIVSRIREIDANYFVVYNTRRKGFEVHNSAQNNTFCLTVPYPQLDCRTIELTLRTRREFLDKLLAEMEENNARIEREQSAKVRDKAGWKLGEMFDFAKSREGDIKFDDAYITKWA